MCVAFCIPDHVEVYVLANEFGTAPLFRVASFKQIIWTANASKNNPIDWLTHKYQSFGRRKNCPSPKKARNKTLAKHAQ